MHNKKITVGIVPTLTQPFGSTDNRYADLYKFTDTYCVRAIEAGMLPIGVLPVENRLKTEILDLCDVIMLQGGYTTQPYHIEVIDHAVKTGKKLLGICLGCQSINAYFAVKAEAEKRNWTGTLGELYIELNNRFLGRVEGHRPSEILPYGDKDVCKHTVYLTEDSQLAKIYGRTEVFAASFHVCHIETPAPGVTVTGRAPDGIIEAIEVGDRIIGTQFHPDVDGELPEIFDWLAKE